MRTLQLRRGICRRENSSPVETMSCFVHPVSTSRSSAYRTTTCMTSRRDFFIQLGAVAAAALVVEKPAEAAETNAAKGLKKGRLYPCPQEGTCLSSSSSAQPTKYIAPWQFEGSAKEAQEKLVEYAGKTENFEVVKQEGSYIWIKYEGGTLGGIADLEFLFRDDDKILTLRAASRRSVKVYAFSVPSANIKSLLSDLRRDLGWEDLDKDLLLI